MDSEPSKFRKGIHTLIIVLVVGSIVIGKYWHKRNRPNPETDYVVALNILASCNQSGSPGLNAGYDYNEAVNLYVEPPADVNLKEIKPWSEQINPEQIEALRKWIQANSEALDKLQSGSRMPFLLFRYEGESFLDIDTSYVTKYRDMAFLMIYRAHLKAMDGEIDECLADIVTCCRFGLHMKSSQLILEQLVGVAVIDVVFRTTLGIFSRGQFNKEQIAFLQKELEEPLNVQSFSFNLRAAELNMLDFIQRVFCKNGKIHKPSVLTLANQFGFTEEDIQSILMLSRGQTIEDCEKYFEYCDVFLSKSILELRNDGVDEKVEELLEKNRIIAFLPPKIFKLSVVSARIKCHSNAFITIMALLRYKADEGQFPENLQTLVANGYLEKLPIDTFSDQLLVYKRQDDDFILYSFGGDFDDDNGMPSNWGGGEQGGDQVFWPVEEID